MNNSRYYPSGAAKKLQKSREAEPLKSVPKLKFFGFESKLKIEGDGDGVQEEICKLKTEGQGQMTSTVKAVTNATYVDADSSGLESSCENTNGRKLKNYFNETLLVRPFSSNAGQCTEVTEDLRHSVDISFTFIWQWSLKKGGE